MRRVVLFLVLISQFALATPESEFLSSFYERPDIAQLESRRTELMAQSNLHAHLATTLIDFHIYLAALEAGRPHLAARSLATVMETCDRWGSQTFGTFAAYDELATRAEYLCAWAAAEKMGTTEWGRFSLTEKLEKYLVLARRGAFPDGERNYLEAQILLALPPAWGQDTRKPLVLLTFLAARHPNHARIKKTLALAHYGNGNFRAAKDNGVEITRGDLDGYSFGITPGIFATPAEGLGLFLQGRDERLFDGARALSATLAGTTRGSFRSDLEYDDTVTLDGARVRATFGFGREQLDFFALGMASPSASRTRNQVTNLQGSLSGVVTVVEPVTLEVGWFGENQRIDDSPFSLSAVPLARSFSYSGPFAELSFDTRDSLRDPLRGFDIGVRGLFPASGLGSSVSFERWDFHAAYYWMLSRLHHFHFLSSFASASPTAPLSAYPTLGGRQRVPGVRADRYRDQKSFFASGEYQLHSRGAFRVAAFGVAGSAEPTINRLSSELGFGGGLALLVQSSRLRASPLRVELGLFKSEWAFQILAATPL